MRRPTIEEVTCTALCLRGATKKDHNTSVILCLERDPVTGRFKMRVECDSQRALVVGVTFDEYLPERLLPDIAVTTSCFRQDPYVDGEFVFSRALADVLSARPDVWLELETDFGIEEVNATLVIGDDTFKGEVDYAEISKLLILEGV